MKSSIPALSAILFTSIVLVPALISFTLITSFKEFKIPVIVSKEPKSGGCLSPKYMLNAWYDIERVEKFSDTLDLSVKADDKKDLYLPQFREPGNEQQQYSNTGLQIIADTINELSMVKKPIWANWLFHRRFDNKRMTLQDDTLVKEVQAYAIYIANISEDKHAQVSTQDGSVIMTLEALNGKGSWEAIEYWSNSWCGNSYFTAAVPPKYYLFTRGVKCSGDFKTKCRLSIKNLGSKIYSNEFVMSINKTQFDKPKEK